MNFVFCEQALADAKNAWRLMTPAQREDFIRWARPSREYVKATIPKDLRWRIFQRDGFKCQYCGAQSHLSIDHIVAESRGGTLDESNLLTACGSCNSAKGSKEYRAFKFSRFLAQTDESIRAIIAEENLTRSELLFVAAILRNHANELERAAAELPED